MQLCVLTMCVTVLVGVCWPTFKSSSYGSAHFESGAALGIFDWGSKVRGSGGRKSPSGVQGQSPGRGLGKKSPRS